MQKREVAKARLAVRRCDLPAVLGHTELHISQRAIPALRRAASDPIANQPIENGPCPDRCRHFHQPKATSN